MRANRLLINMENKIDILKGAINQCDQLRNNETIVLKGLNTLHVHRGNLTDQQLNDRKYELIEEMVGLQDRCYHLTK